MVNLYIVLRISSWLCIVILGFLLVIPRNRWLRLNMTEKLFTGTLNHNQNKTKKFGVSPVNYSDSDSELTVRQVL